LILTSSFPRESNDQTCAYIAELASRLSEEYRVTVLAPADREAADWHDSQFNLRRSRSLLPRSLDPFQASTDLNEVLARGRTVRLLLAISVLCYVVRALLEARRADAILSNWLVPGGFAGALASLVLDSSHVAIEHSGAIHFLRRSRLGRSVTRFVIRHSAQTIAVSNDIRQKMLGVCPDGRGKITVIPMGVETRSFPIETNSHAYKHACKSQSLLFIGRFAEIKGADLLIRAAAGLKDVTLLIAGDGPARCELEKLARSLSVEALFLGRIDAAEREALLSRCDAVVIPSRVMANGRTEGTPVVCLEAMAAGRVVIASESGGLAEIVRHGENGLLFEPGDCAALRERIRELSGNDSLRTRLEARARETAAGFDWSLIAARFAKVIDGAIGGTTERDGSADGNPGVGRRVARA
jgi:glycosyltransferase involved in cell wall biosynthesis